MKVLLPSKEIPLDSIVTKRTGEKKYTLRDRVRIFQTDGAPPSEIRAKAGELFIVGPNAIPADLEILWRAPAEDLKRFLREPDTCRVGCNSDAPA